MFGGRAAGRGATGRDTVLVFDEGVGFNMSQLAPRTRIIADTYVPFRWKPGLCSTFCCRWRGKKNNDLSALDTRFGRNNAAAKRLRDEKLRTSPNAGGIACVCRFGIIQKFNCPTAIPPNIQIEYSPTFSEIFRRHLLIEG